MLRGNYNFSLLIFFFSLSCHWFFLLGVGVFPEAIVTVNDFSLLAIITFVPGDCSWLSGLWQALTAISSFQLHTNFLRGAQKKILFRSFFPLFRRVPPFPLSCLSFLGALAQDGGTQGSLVEKPTVRCGTFGCIQGGNISREEAPQVLLPEPCLGPGLHGCGSPSCYRDKGGGSLQLFHEKCTWIFFSSSA